MQPLTIDAIRRDPELLQALQSEARRARAEYVHQSLAKLLGRWVPHHARGEHQPADLRTACCA